MHQCLLVFSKDHRIGQIHLDQLQGHQPIVHVFKAGSGKPNEINFQAPRFQVVAQGVDLIIQPVVVLKGAINLIDPKDTHSLLLLVVAFIQHADV